MRGQGRGVQARGCVGELVAPARQGPDAPQRAHAAKTVQDHSSESAAGRHPLVRAFLGEQAREAHVRRDQEAGKKQDHRGRPLHRRGDEEDDRHRGRRGQPLRKGLGVVVGDIVGRLDRGQGRRCGVWLTAPLSRRQQPGHQTLPRKSWTGVRIAATPSASDTERRANAIALRLTR